MESDCSVKPTIFLKTTKCVFFEAGKCKKGAQCPFAHAGSELRTRPNLCRTKMCPRTLSGGRCHLADCSFAHALEELRQVPREQTVLNMPASSRQRRRRDKRLHMTWDDSTTTAPPVSQSNQFVNVNDADFNLTSACGAETGSADAVVAVEVPWTRLAMDIVSAAPDQWDPCVTQYQ
eukprot:TRINITY_DN68170_c0_g1_i1.p1 TRINITY_DN68170_c0_g1~~TRINITY_DN68170_c0_g1_i1.p1  ORF type:complete len:177 (+),score=19.76 TRINITY_DN68170_c0_g1_i1:36-566(+)